MLSRDEVRAMVRGELADLADTAIETGVYHWELDQYADAIMALYDATREWTKVTPETPVPPESTEGVVLLAWNEFLVEWAVAQMCHVTEAWVQKAQYYTVLPPLPAPPDQGKEAK